MIILDENIIASQRDQLRNWRIHFSRIGIQIGQRGIDDIDVLPLIHKVSKPTLFTRDDDFYKKSFCHKNYCIVFLKVDQNVVASYIRRFLRHPEFKAFAQRRGRVVRASQTNIHYWQINIDH